MKIGVSSYSFHQAVEAGTLSTYGIVDTAARMGFASIDFAVLLGDDPLEEMCARLGRQARDAGLDVANYAVAADFLNNDLDAEVARVQGEVENAVRLGARTFRHDGAWGLPKDGSARTFQQALPRIAEGCRRVTEYAAARGIRTMVENHGTFLQDSLRLEQLVAAVDHANFGLLVDMGNFLCADFQDLHYIFFFGFSDIFFKQIRKIVKTSEFIRHIRYPLLLRLQNMYARFSKTPDHFPRIHD